MCDTVAERIMGTASLPIPVWLGFASCCWIRAVLQIEISARRKFRKQWQTTVCNYWPVNHRQPSQAECACSNTFSSNFCSHTTCTCMNILSHHTHIFTVSLSLSLSVTLSVSVSHTHTLSVCSFVCLFFCLTVFCWPVCDHHVVVSGNKT